MFRFPPHTHTAPFHTFCRPSTVVNMSDAEEEINEGVPARKQVKLEGILSNGNVMAAETDDEEEAPPSKMEHDGVWC